MITRSPIYNVARSLTSSQYEFIEREFGYSKTSFLDLPDETLVDIYYDLCDIEATALTRKLDMVLDPQNYLKAAEMSVEDDYSMLDGVINNGKAPQLEETPSMLGQLKEKAEACKDTPSPRKPKSKER